MQDDQNQDKYNKISIDKCRIPETDDGDDGLYLHTFKVFI